jgi:hypothetical protein
MKHLLLSFLLICLGSFSFADQVSGQVLLDGKDITAFVKDMGKTVTVLQKSSVIYHWSPSNGAGQDAAYTWAKEWARSFWVSFGHDGSGSMYGAGLYAAVDPVASVDFGGGIDNWLLLEMNLPVGLKIVDLVDVAISLGSGQLKFSKESLETLNDFKCPNYQNDFNKLFQDGNFGTSISCQNLLKKVFQDILKIDGFAYGYGKTNFKECTNYAGNNFKAFVITNDSWITANNTHFYTKDSRENIDNRIMIQTLFLKATEDDSSLTSGSTKSEILAGIANYLDANPDAEFQGSKVTCDADACTFKAQFCSADKFHTTCKDDVVLGSMPRPGGSLITTKEASKFRNYPQLLWSDLEGKPKASTVSDWLKKNIYECTDK